MDNLLHDLVENYAEITPKLRAKTRHPRRPKLAAARSAEANFARRLCRVFARGFERLRVNFQQSVAIVVPSTERMTTKGLWLCVKIQSLFAVI